MYNNNLIGNNYKNNINNHMILSKKKDKISFEQWLLMSADHYNNLHPINSHLLNHFGLNSENDITYSIDKIYSPEDIDLKMLGSDYKKSDDLKDDIYDIYYDKKIVFPKGSNIMYANFLYKKAIENNSVQVPNIKINKNSIERNNQDEYKTYEIKIEKESFYKLLYNNRIIN